MEKGYIDLYLGRASKDSYWKGGKVPWATPAFVDGKKFWSPPVVCTVAVARERLFALCQSTSLGPPATFNTQLAAIKGAVQLLYNTILGFGVGHMLVPDPECRARLMLPQRQN